MSIYLYFHCFKYNFIFTEKFYLLKLNLSSTTILIPFNE